MAGSGWSCRPISVIRLYLVTSLMSFVNICDGIQCLSRSGEAVDWFIIYKLPRDRKPLPDDSFYYMDANQPSWQLSDTTLKDKHDQAVYYTLQQIYDAPLKLFTGELGYFCGPIHFVEQDQTAKSGCLVLDLLNVKSNMKKSAKRSAREDALKWRSSRFILNGKDKPLLKSGSGIYYAMYNDELPEAQSGSAKRLSWYEVKTGHTKGVVGFDEKTAFWLVQSTPKFPNKKADGYEWPSNGNYYAQSFLCISMATDPNLEEIGHQFLYNYPNFYNENISNATSLYSWYPNMVKAASGGHVTSPPWNRKTVLTSLAGKKFYSYAKSREFDADMYSTWIAPSLKDNILVETWQNGRNKLCSNCTGDYWVYNVETVHFNEKSIDFKETEDHAKWAVTNTTVNGAWTCIGDINRQESQMKRGGGTVCMEDANIWSAFRSLISTYHDCDMYRKCVRV